jgi:hypothetical protein
MTMESEASSTSLLLSKLNDRTISFPERCEMAASLLKPENTAKWFFPRKNQFIFDWLTGSLLKLSRSEDPKPEIFLNPSIWSLLKVFAQVLEIPASPSNGSDASLKRSMSQITDDEAFFNYRKTFDSHIFVIKCPLLTIFKTSLSLMNGSMDDGDTVDSGLMCSVILSFLRQNSVSLPVSFLQLTDFINSLVKYKSSLPFDAYISVLKPVLDILSQIILGGSANYKKTYPLLVRFCVESATLEAKDLWIDFMKKCLFPSEYLDELLVFLISPSLLSVINDPSAATTVIDESKTFPRTLTFQKTLFVALATNRSAVESCPLVYESFLRAAGSKINRESGFNFFSFLLRKTIPHASDSTICLSELISVLHSRGNEIYQQRNDQIYRDQSTLIAEIFNSALNAVKNSKSPPSFPLLLALARLNYYLVSEHFGSILSEVHEASPPEAIDFIVGMFELAVLANQLPLLLEIVLNSRLSLIVAKNSRIQTGLSNILARKISPQVLHQIYSSLTTCKQSKLSFILLLPVFRSISKIMDNVDAFDADQFKDFQRILLKSKELEAINLLICIIRYSPGTLMLIDEVFNVSSSSEIRSLENLELLLVLKCKDSARVSLKPLMVSVEMYPLVLKYLPCIADDLSSEFLKNFSIWLLSDSSLCLRTVQMKNFFEILSLQRPFLESFSKMVFEQKLDTTFILKLLESIPWEYFSVCEDVIIRLIDCLWNLPKAVAGLLQLPSPLNIRSKVVESLVKLNLPAFVDFLLRCEENNIVSFCLQVDHSPLLIRELIDRLASQDPQSQLIFVSKMVNYSDFESSDLLAFVEKRVDPVSLIKNTTKLTVELLDALDIVLEWAVEFKMEFVASCILALPGISLRDQKTIDLSVLVRAQALKCKFPARTDVGFILESVNLAAGLAEQSSTLLMTTFRKDLLALLIQLPLDSVQEVLETLLLKCTTNDNESNWKFSLGLLAINQLLQVSHHVPTTFALFIDNLSTIYSKSMAIDLIGFLSVLKSILQLKKNVTWESRKIAIVLGILRRARQAHPECFEEIYVIHRLILTHHIRSARNLIPLLVSNLCEGFADISSVEESASLSRTITELSSFRRGEMEPLVLVPLLYTFISSSSKGEFRKPLQFAMNNLMYHLGTRKQLLQLLSTALVVDHEQRVVLKAFIDEYNKFHRYSGKV